uniref:Uncharacterized protein n=1 Tax=Oryzias sinensis TaxID=183150 RepID=A0A8C7YE80_9TELE
MRRPRGSKKLQVCVTDLNWTNLASPLQPQEGGQQRLGGDPLEAHRGRGRPKGSKKAASSENGSTAEHFPKKPGRPKKDASAGDLPNGGPSAPQRGRPIGSIKRKSETAVENGGSSETPRERGRPKGSHSKKPSTFNGMTETRGRPRKNQELLAAGSSPKKRGRGRPKGSLNKKPPVFVGPRKLGRPPKVSALSGKGKKRGRPRQQPAKRGRPRKYPLPPPEELNKPRKSVEEAVKGPLNIWKTSFCQIFFK